MLTLDPDMPLPSVPMMEKSVLSIILNNPEKFYDAPALSEEHFYHPGRRCVFAEISGSIREQGSRFDTTGMISRLGQTGGIDRLGGMSEIADLLTYEPNPRHFDRHLKQLNEFLARRLSIAAALKLAEAAFEIEDSQELLQAASGPITAIHEAIAEQKPPTSTKALVKGSLQRYLDRANGKSQPRGIDTGIEELDQALRGVYPGRMWVIGAYPSGGKSVIAGQMLTKLALNGAPSVFVTLEMSEDDLMDRCMIQSSQTPADAFVDPRGYAAQCGKEGPTEGIKRALNWAAEKLLTSPFVIRKPSNRTLAAVLSTVRRAHREMGAKVAAIDYVQLIRVPGTGSNKEQEVSEISHSIQELAHELGMHIIVLTQLNADGDTKHGRVIEEDADAFLQIVQDMNKQSETFKQHQHVLIVKDRHFGQSGRKLPLIFDKSLIRFVHGIPEKSEPAKKKANF